MRKKRAKLKPRFFLFLLLLAGIGAAVYFLTGGGAKEEPGLLTAEGQQMFQTLTGEEETGESALPALPAATPAPPLPADLTVRADSSANPKNFGFSTKLMVNRAERDSWKRSSPVSFGRDSEYTSAEGILTFGSNNYRNSFAYGTVTVTDRRLFRTWEAATGQTDTWTGTGWTGQPLIIRWPKEVLPFLGVADSFKTEGFTEVIYPAMDGNIYFFDLNTGTKTRTIPTGFVMKSTPCLDPNGYPILYVGQSIAGTNDNKLPIAYVKVYSLVTNEEIYSFGKHDYFSYREWQAYDGSPLIADDTLFYCGENGILYSAKLNTSFNPETGETKINPDGLAKYRYSGSGYSKTNAANARWYGIESSLSAFRSWLYFTDNGGRLQCVDANTLELLFVQDVGEDADASPVLEESYGDGALYVYTAGQAFTADASLGENLGYTIHKKINALTGAVIWEQKWIASTGDSNNSGGTIATAAVGKGSVDNLVFYAMNLVKLSEADSAGKPVLGGRLVAYDKATGSLVWSVETPGEGDFWSSPVLVYSADGRAYLLQCDRAGMLKLYDAQTGTPYYSLDLGSRIDSTPAVFNNMLVVGTRGKGGSGEKQKIICVRIA